MSCGMDAGQQNQEGLKEKNLRKQLAAAVRSIQWSYGIFWSPSSRKEGVLEWRDGFYNGDIKTRKTTQPMDFKADQLGLQRSDQLRELYESLSAGDSIPHTRRPSASLSPEDLTDTEWYFLVCMSFTFTPGQGLVGKVFASNQQIWLSNAQITDSKIFSRSLLAKSAAIQTVVCFPFIGGVLELGSTEDVAEDAALIQHVTSSFWELTFSVSSEQSISSPMVAETDDNLIDTNFDQEVVNAIDVDNHDLVPESDLSFHFPFDPHAAPNDEMEIGVCSPNGSCNEYFPNQHTEDSVRMEGLNAITSQIQSRHLIDDEFYDGLPVSLNSTDCISQALVNPRRILSSPKGERLKNQVLDCLQEGDNINLSSLDPGADDAHYSKTIAAILKKSKQLTVVPYFRNNFHESSFTVWRKGSSGQLPPTSSCQNMLKKIVVDVSWKGGATPQKPQEDNGFKSRAWRTEGDDAGASHMLSERRRREKLNEKFLILRSLVPSISKVDKASILGDTIEYLKELERRVEELESCRALMDVETRERRKHLDVAERTSDNYANHEKSNRKQASRNKRKACSMDEAETQHHWVASKDGPIDVNVTMIDKDVTIEMHCPWRDCLLFNIIDAISNLQLDALSVQSATADDNLALTVKAKFRGSVVASPGMIRKTLQRVIGKC